MDNVESAGIEEAFAEIDATPQEAQQDNTARKEAARKGETESYTKEELKAQEKAKKKSFEEDLKDELEKDEPKEKKEAKTKDKKEKAEKEPKDKKESNKKVYLAPADMTKEEKEHFEKLDDETKEYITRRSHQVRTELAKQTSEYKKVQQEAESLREVLGEHAEFYRAQGTDTKEVIKNALQLDRAFQADKIGTLKNIIRNNGIDPLDLVEEGDLGEVPQYRPQQLQVNEAQIREQIRREEQSRVQAESQKQIQQQAYQALQARAQQTEQKFWESKPELADPETRRQVSEAMSPYVKAIAESNRGMDPMEVLNKAATVLASADNRFSFLNGTNQIDQVRQENLARASRSISGGPGSASPRAKFDTFEADLMSQL